MRWFRFAEHAGLVMMLLAVCPPAFAENNGTITQVINVRPVNYLTGLPIPATTTVTYTCMNPDGSWYPYAVDGSVGPQGGSFTISCRSPSTFNPWVHVYGQNGYWFGVADFKGILSQGGGAPVNIVVVLYYSYD